MNRFWLNNETDDRNNNCKPEDFDDAVEEDAQEHECRTLPFALVEQPVGPLKDRENGIGVRHGGGQAGDAGKVSVTVRLGVALRFGFGWVSVMNHPSFEILSRNAPHGQHAVGVAGYPRSHAGASANPDAFFKRDVAHHQIEGGLLVVVVAAEQQGALREAAMASDRDLAEVVDPHVFADPGVVTDGEFPWVLDGDSRLEDHAASNSGAEKSQQGALESAGPGEPGLEEQAGDEEPQDTREPMARMIVRVVELVESRRRHQILIERAGIVSTDN